MQTFTIFFGFAIVAIAMENFAANFFHVKSSDAGAKGVQEFQSRDESEIDGKYLYYLHGKTGTETVTIRDGNKTIKKKLGQRDQPFKTSNPKIIIEFTNDECCEPTDKNVLFTPDYPFRISTNDNKNNYFKNWNCSSCSTPNTIDARKQMNLQSRSQKVDMCYETRTTSVDDCTKCSLVKNGQFCYPGNYTIEFKTENQCKDVTVGGCDFEHNILKAAEPADTDNLCNILCGTYAGCRYWRFDRQKELCHFYKEEYRNLKCNTRAGPWGKKASTCLIQSNNNPCDSVLDEDCEYDGEELANTKGQVPTADACQYACQVRAKYGCKYWIYHTKEANCILKKSVSKNCTFVSSPPMDHNGYDACDTMYHDPSKN